MIEVRRRPADGDVEVRLGEPDRVDEYGRRFHLVPEQWLAEYDGFDRLLSAMGVEHVGFGELPEGADEGGNPAARLYQEPWPAVGS